MGVLQTDASQGSSGTASGAGSETVSGPFSLVRGGPIYRLWRRVGLVRHDGPDALRIGLALVVISWVPVMLIALLERAFTGRWPLLVLELSVQARLLIAVPLLAVAEEWADALTRGAMQYLSDAKIMTHEPELQRISASAARMRDSWIGELVLLLAAFATTYGAVWGFGPWRDAAQPPVASTWSATLVWYGVVALPIVQWLAYRWFWRWIIWCYVLVRVSRSPLRLEPAHPDRAGGLRVFADAVLGFVPVAAAAAWVLAAVWAGRILGGGTDVSDAYASFAVLVVVVLIGIFGPLFVFAPALVGARVRGRRVYGQLANDFALLFRRRWIDRPQGPELLDNPHLEGMASLWEVYEAAASTRGVPFGPRSIYRCLLWVLLPLLPLALTETRLRELLVRIFEIAVGKIG